MAKNLILDTGYWIALFNERDEFHTEAAVLEEEIFFHTMIFPWPILYETIVTRLVRQRVNLHKFRKILESPASVLIDDTPYRADSLEFVLSESNRTYSLVDHVLRSMLADTSLSIDGLVTFNADDFHDICARRRIELIGR